ncbi:hypothetical protein [Enterococcus wangshanyuanii]|uniref:hypothetical protein n=1 Tax=Enterococcus wangshanyuanii TaxID=2005703 RepID=UPI000B4A93CE|nr:hypothetical protein [Enterococcus wangshanyuanii]
MDVNFVNIPEIISDFRNAEDKGDVEAVNSSLKDLYNEMEHELHSYVMRSVVIVWIISKTDIFLNELNDSQKGLERKLLMIIINVCIGILIALLVLQFIMLILTITEKKKWLIKYGRQLN